MNKTTIIAVPIILLLLYVSLKDSVGASYTNFKSGTLKGKLIVQWQEPDKFIFLPDKTNPLTFERSNGDIITPGRMITDGGSIPRPLWILRSYSPWGYAPAFIIHDWLFVMKHCAIAGHVNYDHKVAAQIMAETMKTMMEKNKVPQDKLTLLSMHAAVSSDIAKKHWDAGQCTPPHPLHR
jgi:Protein of unknown function (DUF1353)